MKRALIVMAIYLACWVIAHCLMFLSRGDGLGLKFLVSYFIMAWSFSAGELPGFIWLFSLALFGAVLVAWFLIAKVTRRVISRGTQD